MADTWLDEEEARDMASRFAAAEATEEQILDPEEWQKYVEDVFLEKGAVKGQRIPTLEQRLTMESGRQFLAEKSWYPEWHTVFKGRFPTRTAPSPGMIERYGVKSLFYAERGWRA